MTQPRAACRLPASLGGRLDLAILVSLAAAVALVTWRVQEVYADDALIVLRYVANLINGNGWVYNVGEPVNATTSPLHVMALVLVGGLLAGDLLTAQAVVFAIPTIATVAICYLLFRPHGRIPATMAALLAAFGPNRYSTLGMESSLLIACVLGTVTAYASGRMRCAGALLGLATLARPDAGLLGLVLALDCLHRRHPRHIATLAIVSGLVVAPWITYAAIQFGSPFPNTLAIKLAQRHIFGEGPIFLEGAWRELAAIDVRGVGVGAAMMAILFAISLTSLALRARVHRVLALFAVWASLQFAAYAGLGLPPYHWYYAPLLFACAAGVAVTVETLWNAQGGRSLKMLAAIALGTVTMAVSFPEIVAPEPTLPHYRAVGAWLAENTSESASVACADIGIVGYLAYPRRVIDMQGLVSPGAAEAIARGNTTWWFERHHPDIILMHTNPWEHFEGPVLEDPAFGQAYRPVNTPGVRGVRVYARRVD